MFSLYPDPSIFSTHIDDQNVFLFFSDNVVSLENGNGLIKSVSNLVQRDKATNVNSKENSGGPIST